MVESVAAHRRNQIDVRRVVIADAELRLLFLRPIRVFHFLRVAAAEQQDSVVVRLPSDVFHLLIALVNLLLDRRAVHVGIRVVVRVEHFILDGLQDLDLTLDRTLRGTKQSRARLCVAVSLSQRANFYAHFLADGVAGRIVPRARNPLARCDFLQLLAELADILVQLAKRQHCAGVVYYRHRHDDTPPSHAKKGTANALPFGFVKISLFWAERRAVPPPWNTVFTVCTSFIHECAKTQSCYLYYRKKIKKLKSFSQKLYHTQNAYTKISKADKKVWSKKIRKSRNQFF